MTTSRSNDRALDDPTELDRFLTAYRPSLIPDATWLPLVDDATKLVRGAGELTRLRVEKDIQTLGAVVAHLVNRGRPTTIEEVLADATLLSFDTALRVAGKSEKTRENKRGILRRLQSAHRGLPWRPERRVDGERVETMVPQRQGADLERVLCAAAVADEDDQHAVAFTTAMMAARHHRRADPRASLGLEQGTWERARRFATSHGLHLTQPVLRALVTHEVLARSEPVAVLTATFGLTRRDLDLALTVVADLPTVPTSDHHDLLRGREVKVR